MSLFGMGGPGPGGGYGGGWYGPRGPYGAYPACGCSSLLIILAGIILAFAHTLGEFGVVLMVGGNIPGVTRTLSVAIYDDVQALDYASAGRASLVLLSFSFAALCLTHALRRRAGP